MSGTMPKASFMWIISCNTTTNRSWDCPHFTVIETESLRSLGTHPSSVSGTENTLWLATLFHFYPIGQHKTTSNLKVITLKPCVKTSYNM